MKDRAAQQDYYKSFICGGFAGICAKSIIAPFDRIKLFFLVRDRQFRYKEALQDFRYIKNNHGLTNLWRGNSAVLIRIFPYAAIQYSSVDFYRNTFYHPISKDRFVFKKFVLFVCGSMAGVTSCISTYPLELVRTRLGMEKNNFNYTNLRDCCVKIYRDMGVRGFYDGVSTALLGIIPYVGTTFFLFNVLKEQVQIKYWGYDMLFGGVSAIIGQVVAYPFDIVRKRQQGQRLLFLQGEIKQMMSSSQLVRHIHETEGLTRGFYKGLSINFVKGPIATGTSLSIKYCLNRKVDKNFDK